MKHISRLLFVTRNRMTIHNFLILNGIKVPAKSIVMYHELWHTT